MLRWTSKGTQEVTVYACKYSQDRTVYLVDTPGFDDTNRTDTEVLRELAEWLTLTYANEIRLHGILYLHRITDVRMQGTAKNNLFMFKKLCGQDALKNVILATTMWELVDFELGVKRETELVNTQDFWGWMVQHGSQVFRHANTKASAMRLVEIFAGQQSNKQSVALDIQVQMVDENKTLDQTAVGIQLTSELAKERKKFEQQLRQVQQDMKEAMETRDADSATILRLQQEEMTEHIRRIERDGQQLRISMERLHQEKYDKLRRALEQQTQDNERTVRLLNEAQETQREERQRAEQERAEMRLIEQKRQNDLQALEGRLAESVVEANERRQRARAMATAEADEQRQRAQAMTTAEANERRQRARAMINALQASIQAQVNAAYQAGRSAQQEANRGNEPMVVNLNTFGSNIRLPSSTWMSSRIYQQDSSRRASSEGENSDS